MTPIHKYCVCNSGDELLFDLEKDPFELGNVAREPEYSDKLCEMRMELLRRWFDVEKQYPPRTGAY